MARVCLAGFPHSEISGSMDICSSPKLFAAYHVFHRLSVPRHPPCALCCLTFHDSYSVMIMGLGFFRVHRFINLLISWLLPIKITSSDVSIGMIVCLRSFDIYMILYAVFKVQFKSARLIAFVQMEMERFELLTPCLQGRCSPN